MDPIMKCTRCQDNTSHGVYVNQLPHCGNCWVIAAEKIWKDNPGKVVSFLSYESFELRKPATEHNGQGII